MVKAGFLRNMRSACLMSFQRSPTVRSYGRGGGGDKGVGLWKSLADAIGLAEMAPAMGIAEGEELEQVDADAAG